MSTTADLTAGQVMDASAVLLNDAAKSINTYTVQIPYLNMALRELQEIFELNEVPVTDTISAVMTVPAGTDHIAFASSGLKLPDDLIEPQILWERPSGINPYTGMTRVDFLPRQNEGIQINQFVWYTWQSQQLRFFATNQNNDIKMDYIKNLFATVTTSNDQLSVVNAMSFLQFRVAALISELAGENTTRANALNADATLALDRATGISAKGRQNITTRRRPFRSNYKNRSFM